VHREPTSTGVSTSGDMHCSGPAVSKRSRVIAGLGGLDARMCAGGIVLCGVLLIGCGGSKTPSNTSSTAMTATQPSSTQMTSSTVTPPPSSEVSPGVVRASARGVSATMHASTHSPRVNRPWPVSFTVTSAGKPVRAEVRYQYLFAGQVVARRSHYTFTGSFHDVFMWPSSAVGYPLTFRAVISSGDVTLNLDYPVRVAR